MAKSILTKKALAEGLKTHLRSVPFSKITVDDICDAAEVSRRSFYRHFMDKYELLNWLYDYEFCQVVEAQGYKTIWEYYPDICKHLHQDKDFFLHAFSVYGQNSFREFCTEKLYPILMNDFGSAFPNEDVARFVLERITNATFDGFQWWLSQDPCMSPEEYTAFSRKIITDTAKGIAAIDKSQ